MKIKIKNGTVHDPANQVQAGVRDLYIEDDRIVAGPLAEQDCDEVIDATGCVVMAGGIDIHTHIGGGKVNIARMMLPEDHDADLVSRGRHPVMGCGHAAPATPTAGYRYAEMGYTACFEPAMLPANARMAHLELADTPMVDKGAYAMLGNDDLLLRLIRQKADGALIRDYIAWTLKASQALAIKVVNPGGINAFKFNQRKLDVDEKNAHYGVTPRQIMRTLALGVQELGLAHPLHIHGCNLGVPGNDRTTLDSFDALEGIPAHFTHLQFHTYGCEGDRGFSSAAAKIAEAVNQRPNISVDVGQIMFGQTVTESGDSMRQYDGSKHGHPRKWVGMDIECEAGCGVVPFKYRDRNFVNALQWAIGLELFLLIDDPWRVFLTTDHPNGAPFTSYPHLIRLLTDRSFRNDMLAAINPDAAAASNLAAIDREYTLDEIAIMTRAAPARSLGLHDLGQLGPGARADVVIYRDQGNRERMFTTPERVLKAGATIVKKGRVVKEVTGATHVSRAAYDGGVDTMVDDYFARYMTLRKSHLEVADDEIRDGGRGELVIHETERQS